jgi:anti-anti-sigma factor
MIPDFRAVPASDDRFVWLHGELDAATAERLRGALDGAVRSGGPVVLDLTRLAFIDSDGIRALIDVAERLDGRGCVILHNPSEHVGKVFGIVRLSDVPNVHVLDARHGDMAPPDGPGAWSRAAGAP